MNELEGSVGFYKTFGFSDLNGSKYIEKKKKSRDKEEGYNSKIDKNNNNRLDRGEVISYFMETKPVIIKNVVANRMINPYVTLEVIEGLKAVYGKNLEDFKPATKKDVENVEQWAKDKVKKLEEKQIATKKAKEEKKLEAVQKVKVEWLPYPYYLNVVKKEGTTIWLRFRGVKNALKYRVVCNDNVLEESEGNLEKFDFTPGIRIWEETFGKKVKITLKQPYQHYKIYVKVFTGDGKIYKISPEAGLIEQTELTPPVSNWQKVKKWNIKIWSTPYPIFKKEISKETNK